MDAIDANGPMLQEILVLMLNVGQVYIITLMVTKIGGNEGSRKTNCLISETLLKEFFSVG